MFPLPQVSCCSSGGASANPPDLLLRHLRLSSNHHNMKRVDVYIKVEVSLEDGEKLERVVGEIVRQLEKLYSVRSAELSNAVVRE